MAALLARTHETPLSPRVEMDSRMSALSTNPETFDLFAVLFAFGLAVVHLLALRVTGAGNWSRRWLSVAGGVSVAYVLVLVVPEINDASRQVVARGAVHPFLLERYVYLVALVGFLLFYGLEAYAQQAGDLATDGAATFQVHVGSFAVYNGVIGYLLFHQEFAGLTNLALYAVAMALHFLVTDRGLLVHHGDRFERQSRWLLAGAVVVGAGVGYATEIDQVAVAVLFSFVAGAVLFNVIKEELPELLTGRFWAFTAGAVIYAALLLLV